MTIYEQIKKSIIEGELKPGKRLTEEFLSKEFNTSRTPVREAIMQLQMDGLVTPLTKGVIVTEYTKEDILGIYDLRILLEGYAAAQAAINRTDEDILRLKDLNKKYKEIYAHFEENNQEVMTKIMETNNLFHDALMVASQNNYINTLISTVSVTPLIYQSLYWYSEKRFERSINSHETITKGVIEGDAERAKTAMREHMYQGRETVLQLIDENEYI